MFQFIKLLVEQFNSYHRLCKEG